MDELPRDGFRHRPLWLLAALALGLAQAGFALAAFGPERSLEPVLDDRPITSGLHPLHLYHGWLGASNFLETGSTTVFDPNFQAGYPKTPAFDNGSRPAELFLALNGGSYSPRAYKLGVLACLLLVPVAFVMAGRGVGLPAGAAVLAGVIGTAIGWSAPVRRMLEDGELDYLAAGLGALVYASWLVRYSRHFDIESWIVLASVAVAGWYAHPVVWFGLAPVVLGCYFVYAPRRELAWHLGLLGILAAGIAPNLWWLADWYRYWWLAQHTIDQVALPAWADVLGRPREYFAFAATVPFGLAVAVAGFAGLATLWRSGCRCGTGLVAIGIGVALVAARVLSTWPGMNPEGPERLAPLALGFLTLPAAFLLWKGLERAGCAGPGTLVATGALLLVGWCDGPERPLSRSLGVAMEPLPLGLGVEQDEVVEMLKSRTTPDARILWDSTTDAKRTARWTALLPVFTDRAYLGGLGDAGMDSAYCEMAGGKLTGRRLAAWTDTELEEYCHWYNVGWVVCRTRETTERWNKLPMAKPIATANGGAVTLFELNRPRSFILSGSAKWESCRPNVITLTDVVPDANGEVTLSLHNPSTGLRVYPSYITPDTRKHLGDAWSHICLRPHGPVPRVTIVWENP